MENYEDKDLEEILAIQKREESLMKLIQETGCEIVQENGQRKLGGPPPNWVGPPPPKGCEIFVGKIPRDVFEDELYRLFSPIGTIYELRLMMDFSGSNRGYAFIRYTNRQDAARAIEQMKDYELRPGRKIGVLKSIDNCRLFIGGIPKTKTQEEIQAELERLTEGITKVIVYSSITDKTKNRGFAFVEYVNHRAASKARRKLIPERILLWGKVIVVDWAEPEVEIEEDVMSKVTALYVRNLSLTTTEQTLRDIFNRESDNDVQKLKMMRDFAFVHFSSRDKAEKAMKALNGTEINGTKVEITWAKPVKEKKPVKPKSSSRKSSATSMTSVVSSGSLSPNHSYNLPTTFSSMTHGSNVNSVANTPMQPMLPSPMTYSPYPVMQHTSQFANIYSFPPPVHASNQSIGIASPNQTAILAPTSSPYSPVGFLPASNTDINSNRNGNFNSAPTAQRVRKLGTTANPAGVVCQNYGVPLANQYNWVPQDRNRLAPLREVNRSIEDSLSIPFSSMNCNAFNRAVGLNGNIGANSYQMVQSPRPMMP